MHDMKKRFALYGFGFAIGIILVFFFLGGKKASCNWMPNDRMLQIIRSKHIEYSDNLQEQIKTAVLDSSAINDILISGDIDFSKSQVKNNPCRIYLINGSKQQENITITVQVCDSVATIQRADLK
jgi:hypothetical protein